MNELIITSGDFVSNSTTVIEDVSEPLVVDTGSTLDVYVAFSASSLCTVRLLYDENFDNWDGGIQIEILKNLQNIDKLYAIHLYFQDYIYGPNELPYRSSQFLASATTCPGNLTKCGDFTVNQSGCSSTAIYTVSFNLNGHGTEAAPETQYVNRGDYAQKPTDPYEEGYYFGGWFDNQACTGDQFSFINNRIKKDLTLYACWIEATGTSPIYLDASYDSSGMRIGYLYSGNKQSPKDSSKQVRLGWEFKYKWSTCIISNDNVYNTPRIHHTARYPDGSGYVIGSKQIYSAYLGTYENQYELVGISINDGELIPLSFDRYYDMPGATVFEHVLCHCCEFVVGEINTRITPIFRMKS